MGILRASDGQNMVGAGKVEAASGGQTRSTTGCRGVCKLQGGGALCTSERAGGGG